MIQQLLTQIAGVWRVQFAGYTLQPRIELYPGHVEFSQTVRDRTSQPRPQIVRQEITLQRRTQRRYKLEKTPLAASLRCQAIFDPGQLNEQRIVLASDEDYQIDFATPALVLSPAGAAKVVDATNLLLTYTFAGVFALQEFKQLFLADVRAATLSQVEQWASLFVAMLLTEHDALLETFNATMETAYSAGNFLTKSTIDHIRLLDGLPDLREDTPRLRLQF
ncbi:MAG: hypothetical protein NT075_27255, partial [Chloroflexi bacterium]|nr:hypothetical protein [Chloroflexota bacterium]